LGWRGYVPRFADVELVRGPVKDVAVFFATEKTAYGWQSIAGRRAVLRVNTDLAASNEGPVWLRMQESHHSGCREQAVQNSRYAG
jgi:hypothetical protein